MSMCSFDYVVLSSLRLYINDSENTIFSYKGLSKILRRERADIIIVPGFSIATMKAWQLSWLKHIKYIIWSGAIKNEARKDTMLRRLQRKILIKRADGFIAYGLKAREYLISLGAEKHKIDIGINTVEAEFFRNETEKWRNKEKIKKGLKLLYLGQLTQGKRVDLLFFAVKNLSLKRKDFTLTIVGDGPEKDYLQSLGKYIEIDQFLNFEGFKQKSEIPKYFAESDCFLFPSEYDIWGLVLVEAMSAGLPCISSILAGATHDLIINEVNGFALDFNNSSEVAERINWILNNPESAKLIGEKASEYINNFATLEKSACGFVDSIERILN